MCVSNSCPANSKVRSNILFCCVALLEFHLRNNISANTRIPFVEIHSPLFELVHYAKVSATPGCFTPGKRVTKCAVSSENETGIFGIGDYVQGVNSLFTTIFVSRTMVLQECVDLSLREKKKRKMLKHVTFFRDIYRNSDYNVKMLPLELLSISWLVNWLETKKQMDKLCSIIYYPAKKEKNERYSKYIVSKLEKFCKN